MSRGSELRILKNLGELTVDTSQLAVGEETEESPHAVAPLADRGKPDAGNNDRETLKRLCRKPCSPPSLHGKECGSD